jgi:hypothetical protein
MGERPFKIVEIGYLHILLAGYLVSVLCIKADLHYTTFALCNLLVQLELYCVKYQAHKLTLYNLHLLAYVVIAIVVCLVHPVHSSCVHIQYISRLYVTVLGKSCVQ